MTNFFDAYNAKSLSYSEVAKTFAPPPAHFKMLSSSSNTLLIGPRGSGKTTLMKMLTLEALRTWRGPEADETRKTITYTSIYVPADIAWTEMVRALLSPNLDEKIANLIIEASFVTNIFLGVVATMQARLIKVTEEQYPFKEVSCDSETYSNLVKDLASLWKLKIRSISFDGLISALNNRLVEIHRYGQLLEAGIEKDDGNLQKMMPYLGMHMITDLIASLDLFDRAVNENDGRWALLLDEVEIYPRSLQQSLIENLRGLPKKLVLKLALAPCGPHTILNKDLTTLPLEDNDFKKIELWYANKEDAESFCQKVFSMRQKRASKLDIKSQPIEIYGESSYAIVDEMEHSGEEHAPIKRDVWKLEFANLYKTDESFKSYINDKKIDINNLYGSSNQQYLNTIRKIAPLVAFRNAYRGKLEGNLKGRKGFKSAYWGWEAICALSEGNPRWLIAMMAAIDERNELQDHTPIKKSVQQRVLSDMSFRFGQILKNGSTSRLSNNTPISMFGLLQKVGEYFHNRLVVDKFIEDPPMSFTVDDAVSQHEEIALQGAMNLGAIVCYESVDGIGGYKSLKGKRFRLAYILAPEFKLPLRKSKAINLSTILNQKPLIKQTNENNSQIGFVWD